MVRRFSAFATMAKEFLRRPFRYCSSRFIASTIRAARPPAAWASVSPSCVMPWRLTEEALRQATSCLTDSKLSCVCRYRVRRPLPAPPPNWWRRYRENGSWLPATSAASDLNQSCIDPHSNHCIDSHPIELVDLLLAANSSCGNELAFGPRLQLAHYVDGDSLQ